MTQRGLRRLQLQEQQHAQFGRANTTANRVTRAKRVSNQAPGPRSQGSGPAQAQEQYVSRDLGPAAGPEAGEVRERRRDSDLNTLAELHRLPVHHRRHATWWRRSSPSCRAVTGTTIAAGFDRATFIDHDFDDACDREEEAARVLGSVCASAAVMTFRSRPCRSPDGRQPRRCRGRCNDGRSWRRRRGGIALTLKS